MEGFIQYFVNSIGFDAVLYAGQRDPSSTQCKRTLGLLRMTTPWDHRGSGVMKNAVAPRFSLRRLCTPRVPVILSKVD